MRSALIMAGGTGGHIFPALAVAQALREEGWRVTWLGGLGGMEESLVPPHGFDLDTIQFSGVRSSGALALALLPLRILRAFWQSVGIIRKRRPDVVFGFGGYISFPAGMMAVLLGRPLFVHEQNSIAGMANKCLALLADRVFASFPHALPSAYWVGNPLRKAFLEQIPPEQRFARRTGKKKLLVLGGSLGAKALNDIVPVALAAIPQDQRPTVTHQGGAKQIDQLRLSYEAAGVEAHLTPFIENTAAALAEADLVICRAGASTVMEIAAVGAPSVFVPFPFAVDDHQTHNAQFLSDQGAALLINQSDLTVDRVRALLSPSAFEAHYRMGIKAYALRKTDATQHIVAACRALKESQS